MCACVSVPRCKNIFLLGVFVWLLPVAVAAAAAVVVIGGGGVVAINCCALSLVCNDAETCYLPHAS